MPNDVKAPPLNAELTPLSDSPELAFNRLIEQPELLKQVCAHVANGGSLIDLASQWHVGYHRLVEWVNAEPERGKALKLAYDARDEWAKEMVLREVKSIACADIRELYDANNQLLPVSQWPDHIARAVEGVDVDELFEGRGETRQHVGFTKRVRLAKKDKLLIALGKQVGLFKDKVEHSGSVTLEDIIVQSYKSGDKADE